tara:strand:+ start:8662 stop:8853 length:192 start_codon:yes stop_codon:yes gene_type:complete
MEAAPIEFNFSPLAALFTFSINPFTPVFLRRRVFVVTLKAYAALGPIVHFDALFAYGALSAMK